MTQIIRCIVCEYYLFAGHCMAFQGADIPQDIFFGNNEHKKPYPGDNGLQFKLAKGVPEGMLPDELKPTKPGKPKTPKAL